MSGVRGKRGEQLRCTAPKGTEVLLILTSAAFSEVERTPVLHGEVAARGVLFLLAAVRRCPACVAKMPCDNHGPGALKKAQQELGLVEPPPDPPDPNGEHQKLVKQWSDDWKDEFGRFPNLGKATHAKMKRARHEHGFTLLSEAFAGAFVEYRKNKAKPPNIDFVLANPSMYAAIKRSARKGSGQDAPEGWPFS